MKLGCNSLLFGMVDLEAALLHIAWAGYEGVEVACIAGMREHASPGMSRAEAHQLKQRVADLGLELHALDVADHRQARLEQVLPLATALSIPTINLVSGGKSGNDASFQNAQERAGILAELARQSGVRLALKPQAGAAVHNVATALRLMEAVNSPALGLNFDPSHLYRAYEEPSVAARLLGPSIVASHIRDCASRGPHPGPPESQIPGRGQIEFAATLRALHETGYGGMLSVEVVGIVRRGLPDPSYPLSRAMGLAAEARGYLSRCLAALGDHTERRPAPRRVPRQSP